MPCGRRPRGRHVPRGGPVRSGGGAATGTLRYTTEDGADRRLDNPAEGRCYEFEDYAVRVANETDRIAELGAGCGGPNNPVAILHPGQEWPRSNTHPAVRSVFFPRGQ